MDDLRPNLPPAVAALPAGDPATAAAAWHLIVDNNVYARGDGALWCPKCNQNCPCDCCGAAWAEAVAARNGPSVRQLPHEAGVEYRSSG